MYRRYRYFVYFLGALVLGSFLLDWLSNSVRVPSPPRVENSPGVTSPTDVIAAPAAPPADTAGAAAPSYAPSYENPSVKEEEAARGREAPPSEQQTPTGIASSSDIQPPAQPPNASPEGPSSPDRDQTTTSPKSSNAALREIIKPKGR